MKKTNFFFVFFTLLLLSLVFAQQESAGVYKAGSVFSFTQVCYDANYITLSSIKKPDGEILIINQNMTKISDGVFKYDFYLDEKGKYYFEGVSDGCEKSFVTYVEATITGKEFNSGKAIIYFLILVFSIFLFVGLLYLAYNINGSNGKDEITGYIFYVNNLKYLKYFLFGLSYLFFVWINYLSWIISYSYLDFDFLSTIFRFVFIFSAFLILPLFILFVFINIANLIRDYKIKDAIMRGVRIR